MTSSADNNSDGAVVTESTITITDILKMTVNELKAALQSLKIEPKGKRKRDLQMQLVEIVTIGMGQLGQDEDDEDEIIASPSPHRSQTTTAAQNSAVASPIDENFRDSRAPSSFSQLDTVMSVELQIKFRQLELESEERKMRIKIEAEAQAKANELEAQFKARELETQLKAKELEAQSQLKARELQYQVERERQQAERTLQSEREIREHERALREMELASTHTSVASTTGTRAPTFKVEAAVKLVPRFNENDVESFLLSFEKIAQLNEWPVEKYAAVLQAHLSGKALKVFTELTTEQCQNYDTLKAALLTAYSVVPEVYRKRFRTISKYTSETYSEFAFRLALQFKRWTEGEKAYADVQKLRELMQIEQFREGLDPELAIWFN